MRDIRIESRPLKEGVELSMIGELQFCDSQEFMQKVPERVRGKGKMVVFNFDKLKFIDSSGLGAVLYASQACRLQEQQVHVVNANEKLLQSLRTISKVGTFILHEKE